MAFLRSCVQQCHTAGCSSKATEELLTFRNERFGFYCGRHAQQQLRRVLADEQALFERQRTATS